MSNEFNLLKPFSYVIKYKQWKQNIVDDAFSCRYVLLSTLDAILLGFEHIKELHDDDDDFATFFNACKVSNFEKYYKLGGYLFKENHLCVH